MRSFDLSPPICRLDPSAPLDRSKFTLLLPVLAVRVASEKCGTFARKEPMKKHVLIFPFRYVLDVPRTKSILHDQTDEKKRLILLKESSIAEMFPQDIRHYIESEAESYHEHQVVFDYDYWTADSSLYTPRCSQWRHPTSFTLTGHLAHFNLKELYLPWKYHIGQIVLDKNKGVKTVVNKLETIDNEFRFFKMELLAGEPDYVVEVHESNCRFKFDFSQVYWNSRLHSEHERLVSSFDGSDVIADVFAGVGPFSIPAAKKGCAVFGNDLNPNSAKYMQANAEGNKVAARVRVSCEDGREFIRRIARESWHTPFPGLNGPFKTPKQLERESRHRRNHNLPGSLPVDVLPRRYIGHFVMNLPGMALEFLDAFRGCLSAIKNEDGFNSTYDVMPLVHCHCFTRESERDKAEADIRRRAETALGEPLPCDASFHFVRAVAPNKDMYCVSFRPSRELMVGDRDVSFPS
ncbi:Met-10+ like-protein-domain-containing protein [Cantharellus anzutake]|uniref:Met-10+ like-protein-domain-containing protein n=1 Tax=Cantharellus anzutake TaxID=1750568 RepID=UPI0019067423|nr:Met-10+ like-protein-domain-containing protein [Cantharellus anzutake]KAF8327587.1 Met-10+ like-protein-domain-containing protein [Cantharellus anzutake]